AAGPGGEVVFEIRVAATDLAHALERRLRERRPPEVRVHDHARRVEDAAQAGRAGAAELVGEARLEIPGIGAGAALLARPRAHRARGLDGEWIAARAGKLVHGWPLRPFRAH